MDDRVLVVYERVDSRPDGTTIIWHRYAAIDTPSGVVCSGVQLVQQTQASVAERKLTPERVPRHRDQYWSVEQMLDQRVLGSKELYRIVL
jgi:hypothetical protein